MEEEFLIFAKQDYYICLTTTLKLKNSFDLDWFFSLQSEGRIKSKSGLFLQCNLVMTSKEPRLGWSSDVFGLWRPHSSLTPIMWHKRGVVIYLQDDHSSDSELAWFTAEAWWGGTKPFFLCHSQMCHYWLWTRSRLNKKTTSVKKSL